MKPKKVHIIGIALVAAIVSCAAALSGCRADRRNQLLCEAGHQAVLKAGREVLAERAKGNLDYGWYAVRDGYIGHGFRLPRAIADLEPRKVLVLEDGYLRVEMEGGLDHFGVNIFPEDFKEPFSGYPRGDRKLLDGLWYYDDQYKWPDYAQKIDDALRKCGRGETGR